MNLIIASTGEVTLKIIEEMLKYEEINIIGVILDNSVEEEYLIYFEKKLRLMKIPILSLDDEILSHADIIFMCEYRKLIPPKYTNNYIFINCHAGILPKWKGFSANAWALINGENEIGYTFHRVDERMDAGDIYKVEKIAVKIEQTYADVHEKMIQGIINDTAHILLQIYNGELKAYEQEGEVCYGTRFNPEFGELKDFDVDSLYIYNLYRCMKEPLGTGMYFYLSYKKYHVSEVILGTTRNVCNYVGLPGKIVNQEENNEVWVKTKDNIIILRTKEPLEHSLIGKKIGN